MVGLHSRLGGLESASATSQKALYCLQHSCPSRSSFGQGNTPQGMSVNATDWIADLNRQIALYERRYEVESATMCKELSAGIVRETAEVLRWMCCYHAFNILKERVMSSSLPLDLP